MAKVAYKAKYEEANARIAALEAMVQKLANQAPTEAPTTKKVAAQGKAPQGKAPQATVKQAKVKQPKNVGVADSIILIDPETGHQPGYDPETDTFTELSKEESMALAIRSNAHGDQVNFVFANVDGKDASVGKPIPALLTDIQNTNADVPRKGYAHNARRWYMERSRFDAFVKRNKVTVY